jgi:hypothetical protein
MHAKVFLIERTQCTDRADAAHGLALEKARAPRLVREITAARDVARSAAR